MNSCHFSDNDFGLPRTKRSVGEKINRDIYIWLADHIYDIQDSLPSRCTLEETQEEHHEILIGYYRFSHSDGDINILSIRGTDNLVNKKIDAKIVACDSNIGEELRNMANKILEYFEKRHGKCTYAVGHSLGGHVLEKLPERIQCFSFNSFHNHWENNIIAFRAEGDPADTLVGHTDFWVKTPYHTSLLPNKAHKIKKLVENLDGVTWDQVFNRWRYGFSL